MPVFRSREGSEQSGLRELVDLKSRMREIRPSGSEGGVAQPNAPSLTSIWEELCFRAPLLPDAVNKLVPPQKQLPARDRR